MNVCVLSHLSLSSTSANIISYKCRIDVVSCVCVCVEEFEDGTTTHPRLYNIQYIYILELYYIRHKIYCQ